MSLNRAQGCGSCEIRADLSVKPSLARSRVPSGRYIGEGAESPPLDSPVRVLPMSQERGMTAAQPIVRPAAAGVLGLLLVVSILRLVILLGWRDGGSAED